LCRPKDEVGKPEDRCRGTRGILDCDAWLNIEWKSAGWLNPAQEYAVRRFDGEDD
jgi:hypothetical protein